MLRRGARLVGWLLLAAATPSAAQDLVFGQLSVEQGLSQTWVLSVLKDSRGFLWIGTAEGLDRYDGRKILEYRAAPGEAGKLGHGRIQSLLENRQGLWVGTGAGLYRYDRERDRFELAKLAGPEGLDNIQAMSPDSSGRIWLATNRGLVAFDPVKNESRRHLLESGAPSVVSVLVDSRDRVWIGRQGFERFDPATGRATGVPIVAGDARAAGIDARSLHQDSEGRIWISNQIGGGLVSFDPETGRVTRYLPDPAQPGSIGTTRIQCTFADGRGRLYVGTENGGLEVLEIATGRFRRYLPRRGDDRSLRLELDLLAADRRPGHPLGRHLQRRAELQLRGPAPLRPDPGAAGRRAFRPPRRFDPRGRRG